MKKLQPQCLGIQEFFSNVLSFFGYQISALDGVDKFYLRFTTDRLSTLMFKSFHRSLSSIISSESLESMLSSQLHASPVARIIIKTYLDFYLLLIH